MSAILSVLFFLKVNNILRKEWNKRKGHPLFIQHGTLNWRWRENFDMMNYPETFCRKGRYEMTSYKWHSDFL